MTQTTYEVKLSVDGNHTVTVRTDNQAEAKLAIAWAKVTFNQLVHGNNQAEEQNLRLEIQGVEETPVCGIHGVPMAKVQGRKGEFWSCHQKNANGSWCSYRPSER